MALGLLIVVAATQAADPPKVDSKTAEVNLRKAQDALKTTDSTLKYLSKTLYAGSVLTKNPDLKEISKFTEDLRKPVGELKSNTDKIVELAEKQKDKSAAEKESKTLLEKVKAIKISNQAETLESLAKKVRDLPVGLVSEHVDEKFVVSANLLVKDPKEAEARFKAYLAAMKINADYLKAKQEQLEDAGKVAKGAGTFLAKVQAEVEKTVPYSGIYAKALTEFYLDLGKLAKAYNELASDCAAKAKEAGRAREVEQKRYNNLKESLKTYLGFNP
jgi:hypothetical protein